MNNVELIGQVFGVEKRTTATYFMLSIKRLSGVEDIIKCCANNILSSTLENDATAKITGELKTKNYMGDDNKSHVMIYIIARDLKIVDAQTNNLNMIRIDGYVCKKPIYRVTPSGTDICDLLVASNRIKGKTDYIPCIAWYKNAYDLSRAEVGTHICIIGRVQSREYEKKYDDGVSEIKVAYEVSISSVDIINEEDGANENSN